MSNAEYDDITAHINQPPGDFHPDNPLLVQAADDIQQVRQAGDIAFNHVGSKDFVSNDLKKKTICKTNA